MGNDGFTQSKGNNRGGDGSPSSGFADLSTWCCDAYPHIRSNSLPLEAHRARLLAIADQPTLVLPRLVTAPFHIADLPTEPDLPAVSAGVAGSGLSIAPAGAKKRGVLARLWQSLLRATRRLLHPRQRPVPTVHGDEKRRAAARGGKQRISPTRNSHRQAAFTPEDGRQTTQARGEKQRAASVRGEKKQEKQGKDNRRKAMQAKEEEKRAKRAREQEQHRIKVAEEKKQAMQEKAKKKRAARAREEEKREEEARKRVKTSKGRKMIEERLREWYEKGEAPRTMPSPALRPARVPRPPTDQLFG